MMCVVFLARFRAYEAQESCLTLMIGIATPSKTRSSKDIPRDNCLLTELR